MTEVRSTREAELLVRFCERLQSERIPYVIVSGWQYYPELPGDIDIVVRPQDFTRLPALFAKADFLPGCKLVQRLQHESTACYFVFAQSHDEGITFLHADVSCDYRKQGRLWMDASAFLDTREWDQRGFWKPSEVSQFKYYLIKKIAKGTMTTAQVQFLRELYERRPAAETVVRELLPWCADEVIGALRRADPEWFVANAQRVAGELKSAPRVEPVGTRLKMVAKEAARRFRRVASPTGLTVAIMGPDGSGKSTIIEALRSELAPAFRHCAYYHLQPVRFRGTSSPVKNPYAKPRRGILLSLAKLAVFTTRYVVGWTLLVWPQTRRSTLVIFDRYFYDLVADPMRYRLSGTGVAKILCKLAPEPDVGVLLTAAPELLVQRKNEATLEHAGALVRVYQSVCRANFSHLIEIDTGADQQVSTREVSARVLEFMARKISLQSAVLD
jgi:thymidylate kinase